MTNDRRTRYETIKQLSKDELNSLDQEQREEVIRAKQKIEEIQKTKMVVKGIYDNACFLLGVKGVLDLTPPPDTNIIEMKDRVQGDAEKPTVLPTRDQSVVESDCIEKM